ncbi:MAG: RsmE family RNA methyltransferase [Candidatus Izemoplasmataceae bacterium]
MQRYFIENEINQELFDITDSNQCHHIVHVMRMKKGDKIIVCDQGSHCYQVEIIDLNKTKVTCKKLLALPLVKKPYHVTLAQSLIRKDHFELVFQKATELGADTIIPIETKRTIIKTNDKTIEQKIKRWESIITEASEQSHRSNKPKIKTLLPLTSIDFKPFDHIFVAYEQEKTLSFKTALKSVKPSAHLLVIIGPEGGFTEDEIAFLNAQGVTSVSLGPRILRSETAAIYALSAISLMLEMSD